MEFDNRLILDGAIVGTVDLQRRSDDSLVEVCANMDGGTSTCTLTASSGACTLTVPVGNYDITVEMDLYPGALRTGVTATAGITKTLPEILLLGGDTNDDDTVNILDLSFLGARFGTSCGVPLYDQTGDINDDCLINILALSLKGSNFPISSPVPWR
ncbi:MAG: hypothetical protein WA996_08260 [Candidatus Promineifilaceae bacterium]